MTYTLRRVHVLVDALAFRKKMETADIAQAVRMAQNASGEDFTKYMEKLTDDE